MAHYDHLRLRRVSDSLERKKSGGFPPTIERNHGKHGRSLGDQADKLVAKVRQRPAPEGINPSLILKVRAPGYTTEEDWHNCGFTVLEHKKNEAVIVFASDVELTQFKQRLGAYTAGPKPGNVTAPHQGFFAAIDEIEERGAEDRVAETLAKIGIESVSDFDPNIEYLLDVELWRPDDEFVLVFIKRTIDVVEGLGGESVNEYHGSTGLLLRIRGSGEVFRALCDLDEVEQIVLPPVPDEVAFFDINARIDTDAVINVPPDDAVCIGIVDSGINDGHPLLEHVVEAAFGVGDLEASDEWGHGTKVAGIAAYGDLALRLEANEFAPRFRIASARVLNDAGAFQDKALAPQIIREAIEQLVDEYGCRIINMSLGDKNALTGSRASLWAEELDKLVRERDLVIVVSAGNSDKSYLRETYEDTIADEFPGYLNDEQNRLCVPAGAINVVTVGALSRSNGIAEYEDLFTQVVSEQNEPSPFTRTGPGLNGSFKPDFVDIGGTAIFDGGAQKLLTGEVKPSTGVLTLNHLPIKRPFASSSGTSMSAPLVAYKAGSILQRFPNASANLIRTLLALSAELPDACFDLFDKINMKPARQVIGHGVPDIERAIFSDTDRVILYYEGELEPNKFAVFEIPVPEAYQSIDGHRYLDVALAFDPPVRRSRRDYAGARMEFDIIRGLSEEDVVEGYRKLDTEEDQPPNFGKRHICEFEPRKMMRRSGTLQRGSFVRKQDISDYGDTYYLVVRHLGGWEELMAQNYSVAVMLRHTADVRLYENIRVRLQAQETV